MKYTKILTLISIVMFSLSCKNNQNTKVVSDSMKEVVSSDYGDVSVLEAKKMIANNKQLVIIDVRTPSEIAEGKIEGALEINISDPSFQKQITDLSKDKEYLVYCKSGGRSSRAKDILKTINVDKVYNLSGGYTSWAANSEK